MTRTRISLAVAVVLVGLSLSGPSIAAVRYVSPSGNDANSGASTVTAWATIARANTQLRPGDVCLILPGTYTHAINPSSSGTATAPISYIGDLSNPGAVIVPQIRLSKEWIRVKGVNSTDNAHLTYPAREDSIAYCRAGGLTLWGVKRSVVARNAIQGKVSFMANDGRACFTGQEFDPGCQANTEFITLSENVIQLGTIKPGERGFQMRGFTQQCRIERNWISAVFDKAGSTLREETFALILFNSYDLTFRDNRWVFEAATAPPENNQWEAFRLRDSTQRVLFERDTMLCGLNSAHPVRGLFSASGSFVHSAKRNRWNECFFKSNSYFYTQDQFIENTIENSVFASDDDNALWFQGDFVNSTLRHNTFYSGGQSVRFTTIAGSSNVINSNIFYSARAGNSGNTGGTTFFDKDALNGFRSNFNVYFSPDFSAEPGDRSIGWCCFSQSKPGRDQPWFERTGQDGDSRYGSPLFADSSFATLNPHLLPGSRAIGAGEGGGDAGAYPSSGGQDVTPPATVTDLTASQSFDQSALLEWTSPGDDGWSGRPAHYELRWSAAPITAGNFATATPVEPEPSVRSGGASQMYLVTGLTPGTRYYFALTVVDDAGNTTPISNVVTAVTRPLDDVSPSVTSDVQVGP